jgi:hypothetical protein
MNPNTVARSCELRRQYGFEGNAACYRMFPRHGVPTRCRAKIPGRRVVMRGGEDQPVGYPAH